MAYYNNATAGVAAAQLILGRGQRYSVVIQNNHATQDLYLGTDSGVTTTNGLRVRAGESIRLQHRGPIFAIASGAGTDVRYFEESYA